MTYDGKMVFFKVALDTSLCKYFGTSRVCTPYAQG